MIYLANINLNQNELQNAVISPLTTAPATPKQGQIYYDKNTNKLMQYNGKNWQTVGMIVEDSDINGNIKVDGVEMTVYALPTATTTQVGGVKVGAGLTVSSDGTLSATGGGTADAVEWASILSKPDTIEGYGITDAKIDGNTITLGNNTINIVSSVDGVSGAITTNAVKTTIQDLTENQKQQARTNIGAGTSSFSGSYNDLTDKPTIDTEMSDSSINAVQNKVIKSYVDKIVSASQGLVYKGTINSVDDIPTTYEVGWLYVVGTAGTYVGQKCEVGDMMIAVVARQGSGNENSDWDIIQTNIDGAITEIAGITPIVVDGENAKRTISMADSGVTAKAYGDTTAQTPAFGATFKVPSFTVDKFGRLTVAGEHTVTIPDVIASASANGLLTSADYTLLHGLDTDVTKLKQDVSALQTSVVTKYSLTLTAGQTSATQNITSGSDILSIEASNATTGETIMVDSALVGTVLTISIETATDYDIKIIVVTL